MRLQLISAGDLAAAVAREFHAYLKFSEALPDRSNMTLIAS